MVPLGMAAKRDRLLALLLPFSSSLRLPMYGRFFYRGMRVTPPSPGVDLCVSRVVPRTYSLDALQFIPLTRMPAALAAPIRS